MRAFRVLSIFALILMSIETAHSAVRLKAGAFVLPEKILHGGASPGLGGDMQTPREWVIQFYGIIPRTARADIESRGVRVLGYLPDNSYLVLGAGKALSSMLSSSVVRALVPYQTAWKTPALDGFTSGSGKKRLFQVRVFGPWAQAALVQKIRSQNLGVIHKAYSSGHLLFEGSVLAARELAQTIGVEWIQVAEGIAPHIFDPVVRSRSRHVTNQTLTGYESGSKIINVAAAWNAGLTGRGQLVTVGDTGLDSGSLSSLHPDVKPACIGGIGLQSSGQKTWADAHGHGTHVAGSVVGNGSQSQGALRGVAFESSVFIQGMLIETGGLSVPADLTQLFDMAYQKGSRIHSNSWGGRGSFGEYDSNAADADTFLSKNPDTLILFASGNSGVDANRDGRVDEGSVTSPATAKNVLSVGASENLLTTGGIQQPQGQLGGGQLWPVAPLKDDLFSNNPNGLAAFSSRGPTKDGRLKPEVVAPGTNILSVRSSFPGAGTLWGVFDENYVYSGGTSMATPIVAGGAALLRQYLTEKLKIPQPSGALMKALFIHTATDLFPGQYGDGQKKEIPTLRPNNHEGFGRVDLARLTTLTPGLQWSDEKTGLATGEAKTFAVKVGQEGHLLVTLTYFDAPGLVGSAQALVNDLDLEVQGLGRRGLTADRVNNTEMIEAKVAPGTYRVTVRGVNVPMGTSPGNRQSFALVLGR